MAEVTTIARPYAEAVFELADKSGSLAAWFGTLSTMAMIAADPQMREASVNPRVTAERLYGLFASLCGDALPLQAQNLLRVLIENRRLELLPQICASFEELKNEREGVVEAAITTAFPLAEAQLALLVADLEKRFKRKVRPMVTLDKDLIGGVRVVIGDEVIDGSVRSKLAALATGLAKS
jgi:F-type H+-transporting ATPase subunit delta